MKRLYTLLLAKFVLVSVVFAQTAVVSQPKGSLKLSKTGTGKPRNIIYILADDHRYDALGFLHTQDFIETPNLDRMAREGAYLPNAFVNNSLCSPSRATILTGLYSHKHTVIDNNHSVPPNLVFFRNTCKKLDTKLLW
ncbi:sulfatase-like hydrolase/transferase [Mucilaginibacter antarcticus]|uniref:sulfatase-like hydrolase/transferase n=1 Tax=Mucilaginibacter antarcticus TaxID=1855725 RepID=UPI0036422957